jgi:hypothetical protein
MVYSGLSIEELSVPDARGKRARKNDHPGLHGPRNKTSVNASPHSLTCFLEPPGRINSSCPGFSKGMTSIEAAFNHVPGCDVSTRHDYRMAPDSFDCGQASALVTPKRRPFLSPAERAPHQGWSSGCVGSTARPSNYKDVFTDVLLLQLLCLRLPLASQ